MNLPDCYDPAVQEAANALAWTARALRQPRCIACGCRITTEKYLDLEPFGIMGFGCEACMNKHSHWTDRLEETYE